MENNEIVKVLYVFDLFDNVVEGMSIDSLEIHQQYNDGRFLKFISVPIEDTKIFERERHPLFKIVLRGHNSQLKDSPPVG